MKNAGIRIALVVVFTALYNYFFWYEKLGVNLFLFTGFLLVSLLWQHPGRLLNRPVVLTALATVLTGVMVVWHNSVNARLAHLVSFFLVTGFIQQRDLRSLYYSLGQVISSYIRVPSSLNQLLKETPVRGINSRRFWFVVRLVLFPLILLGIFYLLFFYAVPEFGKAASTFFGYIGDALEFVFGRINFQRVLFIVAGLLLVGGILVYRPVSWFPENEQSQPDALERRRISYKNPYYRVVMAMNELRKEYKAAFFLLVAINLLLLIVNIFDVRFVWFHFRADELVLKTYVHEGTWLLVISIFLSMIVVLYYFRRNLHFYPGNRWLKRLAMLWMAQNLVLAVSVLVRNSHYIQYHGLAYKRIGVMIFLALTMAGLVSMVIKIYRTRTAWYLLRVNTWAAYAVLVLTSLVNWDVLVARVNLNHWNTAGIDVDFYQQLSPKALPLVLENMDKVEKQIEGLRARGYSWFRYQDISAFRDDLRARVYRFMEDQDHYTWLSWNKADRDAYACFATYIPRWRAENHELDFLPSSFQQTLKPGTDTIIESLPAGSHETER